MNSFETSSPFGGLVLCFVGVLHKNWVGGPPTCNPKAIFWDLVKSQHKDINKVPEKHSVPIFLGNWIAGGN